MARSDLLPLDHVNPQYLIVLKPARRPTDFALFDALNNIFRVAWSTFGIGDIIDVADDGVSLTSVSSSTLSAGEFFHDQTNEFLFVRLLDNTDPNLSFTVVTFEIYLGTFDAHFQRIPTSAVSSSNRVVYWEPFVIKSPLLSSSITDGNLGFIPPSTSSINISNAKQFFEPIVFDASFNQKKIEVYHYLRDDDAKNLSTDLFKLVLEGLMANVNYSQDTLTIQVLDKVNLFLKEWRNIDASFYTKGTFSELDPNFVGQPIRYVYGRVEGFIPVNLDFKEEEPTTSDNRVFGVRADKTETNEISLTVVGGSTTTVIEFGTTPTGIVAGDTVKIDKTTDEFREVTVVSATSITVFPALASGAPVGGDTVLRGTISRVTIIQDDVKFIGLFDRDYIVNTSLSDDVLGITLSTSIESTLGIPITISPNDEIFVTVYGKENNVTKGGPAFGSDDTQTGNLTAPAVILFDILKRFLGLDESEIDLTSFDTLQSSTTEPIGFAIPRVSQDSFPNFQDVISDFVQTLLLKILFDTDNKLEVIQYSQQTTSDFTIEDIDIELDSVNYEFDFSDLVSDVTVSFAHKERSDNVSKTDNEFETVNSTNNLAKFLHGADKQLRQKSLHTKSADAQTLSDRLSKIFGDRQGRLTLSTNRTFFDNIIGDKIKIKRDKLPGFAFVKNTLRERNFTAIGVSKSLQTIILRLDDQKGANDATSF